MRDFVFLLDNKSPVVCNSFLSQVSIHSDITIDLKIVRLMNIIRHNVHKKEKSAELDSNRNISSKTCGYLFFHIKQLV